MTRKCDQSSARNTYRFTWRTIQTWYSRYKKHGITGMTNQTRSDKGTTRKITPEEVLEAINTVLPHFHGQQHNKAAIYRLCIEKGLLRREQIAPNTFSRMVAEYEMLKEDVSENKRRLAFSMQYANQLWQADTMFGPYVQRRQAKLIAFIDDASRVLCHGEFFFEENADAMVKAIRAAFYKRGVPEQLLVDNCYGPNYSRRIARIGTVEIWALIGRVARISVKTGEAGARDLYDRVGRVGAVLLVRSPSSLKTIGIGRSHLSMQLGVRVYDVEVL